MTPGGIVEFAEELARIAAAGGGCNALAASLAQATGGGVLVEDSDWRHIAAAGTGTIPATARDLFELTSGLDRLPRPHRNGRAGVTISILAGTAHLGWLSLFSSTTDPQVEALLRLTASSMAVELAREQSGGRGRRRSFWERLATGAYADTHAVRDDAATRGVTVAPQYVVVALEGESADDASGMVTLRNLAAEAFHAGDAEMGILERGTRLLVLVPAAREVDVENAQTAATLLPKTAAKRKLPLKFSGGVSSAVSTLDVPRGIAAAETALAITRRLYGDARVAAYVDLGVYPFLFEGADVEALRSFATSVLAPLRDYDEKHQTELERTLRLYFSVGENVKTASEQLNVHRHTVFYRLRQIGEISGRSLENAHDQLTLRLAIAIDALHTA